MPDGSRAAFPGASGQLLRHPDQEQRPTDSRDAVRPPLQGDIGQCQKRDRRERTVAALSLLPILDRGQHGQRYLGDVSSPNSIQPHSPTNTATSAPTTIHSPHRCHTTVRANPPRINAHTTCVSLRSASYKPSEYREPASKPISGLHPSNRPKYSEAGEAVSHEPSGSYAR